MHHLEPLPAPRIMGIKPFLERFEITIPDQPDESTLIQMWAIARGRGPRPTNMVLVAISVVGGGDDPLDLVPMEESEFASLVPMSSLIDIPGDTSVFEEFKPTLIEGCVGGRRRTRNKPRQAVSAQEALDLSNRWSAGRRPVRETLHFFARALPVLPAEVSIQFVEVYQKLQSGFIDDEAAAGVSFLCRSIADGIAARETESPTPRSN
ncbi:MAG: hypothetical protein ACKOA6_00870 [Actinomycetota bacterium]